MRDISSKIDNIGDLLKAGDFNANIVLELQGLVESADFTLDAEGGPDTDTNMLAKTINLYVNAALFYLDTGAADAYDLSRVGNLQALSEYREGGIVIFQADNTNSGASTIDVDGLGVKDLVGNDGAALTGGEITADGYVMARYVAANDNFQIVYSINNVGAYPGYADQTLFNPSPNVNLTANGEKKTVTVDSNATGIGALLYQSADGNYDESDASAAATMPVSALALETGTGSKSVLTHGYFRDDTFSWTPGSTLYADITTGAITDTYGGFGTGDQVQIIGRAESVTVIFFDPDPNLIELA